MDTEVLAALARWPDVPDVYGWLHLDQRGRYRMRVGGAAGGARFETIGNAALNAFIGRNYRSDERGRWYFQNGPQRVFVRLALTPWVYRIDARGVPTSHTGLAARRIDALVVDEFAAPVLLTDLGPGAVDDRDLGQVLGRMTDAAGRPIGDERLESWLSAPTDGSLCFTDRNRHLPIRTIARAALPRHFGFDTDPVGE